MGEATGVSADGSVIVGWRREGTENRAFAVRNRVGETLPPLDENERSAIAWDVSDDGSLIVGQHNLSIPSQDVAAVYWDAQGALQFPSPVGATATFAYCVSGDGRLAAGSASGFHVWRDGQLEQLAVPAGFSEPLYFHGAFDTGSALTGYYSPGTPFAFLTRCTASHGSVPPMGSPFRQRRTQFQAMHGSLEAGTPGMGLSGHSSGPQSSGQSIWPSICSPHTA